MIVIAHRGNLTGPDSKKENTPNQIKLAIKKGFDVEIDLWVLKDKLYLGHDIPQYKISYRFLSDYQNHLWIHCKNIEALLFLKNRNSAFANFNYFWHENDKVTLTSKGILWCYPGTYVIGGITVNCRPDWQLAVKQNPNILGICTDYPSIIKF